MDLSLLLVPLPPQLKVQEDQLLQPPQVQSCGHGATPQATDWLRSLLQGRPEPEAGVRIFLERVLLPPPQVLEHVDQGLQSAMLQSTGHGAAAHPFDSMEVEELQGLPPQAACDRAERVLFWEPDPHVFEHEVQLVQPDQAQSWGQPAVLQTSNSWFEPLQGLPPKLAATANVLDLLVLAPPHDFGHCDQGDQSAHLQFTGQTAVPQTWELLLVPVQGAPPPALS